MIYPETFEDKLGFGQIRQKLKDYCLSAAGATWVDDMRFSREVEVIRTQLQQNLEFRQILEKSEAFPSRYFFDPTDWLQKIALEGNWLEADEFLNLAYSLETVMAARQFLSKAQDIYPELYRLAQPVMVTGTLVQAVTSRIDDKATVRDGASPELSRLRKRLREEQGRLRNLARLATALQRVEVPKAVLLPLGARPLVNELGHPGLDQPGANRIDPHV